MDAPQILWFGWFRADIIQEYAPLFWEGLRMTVGVTVVCIVQGTLLGLLLGLARLADARLPAFNWPGLGAYGVGTVAAFSSPWVAPLVGIAAAALTYVIFTAILGARSASAPLQDL